MPTDTKIHHATSHAELQNPSNALGATKRSATNYHMSSQWKLPWTPEQIADVFLDSQQMGRWWASNFLDVTVVKVGGTHGLGRVVNVITKGFMPYELHFQFTVTEVSYPNLFKIQTTGDFEGLGVGRLTSVESGTLVNFDWRNEVRKPLLRKWSWILKPLFVANHYWVMFCGRHHVDRYLRSQRGQTLGSLPRLLDRAVSLPGIYCAEAPEVA